MAWRLALKSPFSTRTASEALALYAELHQSGAGCNWDARGNMVGVVPPAGDEHEQGFTARDLLSSYLPPALDAGPATASVSYGYTPMGELASTMLANGLSQQLVRGSHGKVLDIVQDDVSYTNSYDAVTGQLSAVHGSDGTVLSFSWDGSLLRSSSWGGSGAPVQGTVARTFNSNFAPATLSVNGASTSAFTYDRDGLLTGVGLMTATRSAQTGDVLTTTLGTVTTQSTYSEHGELATHVARVSGSPVYEVVVNARDGQGRIVRRTETVLGVARLYEYAYDALGRLEQVKVNGSETRYSYDENGNRLVRESEAGVEEGSYDAQDRVMTYGDCSYEHDAAGFLRSRTCAGNQDLFEYDVRGALRSVELATGDALAYLVDATGRRIGKRRNGVFERGWLYGDALRPVAELNASGAVQSVFVYGGGNAPEYMLQPASGKSYRIVTDQLGSPRLVVDTGTGTLVQRIDYDEFGRVTSDTNPGFQPFGFAGGLYDPDTGLVRFGARDYDAFSGRWTARDPSLFRGGDANLYAYVHSDPINFIDATGRQETAASSGRPESSVQECARECNDVLVNAETSCDNSCSWVPDRYCRNEQTECRSQAESEATYCILQCQGREWPGNDNVGRPDPPPDAAPGCGFSPW